MSGTGTALPGYDAWKTTVPEDSIGVTQERLRDKFIESRYFRDKIETIEGALEELAKEAQDAGRVFDRDGSVLREGIVPEFLADALKAVR